MTSIREFRRALADVPAVLLSSDDHRVLADARTALDVLSQIDVVPRSVVFVGPSGSGKSSLVNATLGVDVADTGVRRPTTQVVSMYGGSGPVSLAARSEYIHVPSIRPGLVVIDTPPWEHEPDAVRSAIAVADLAVMVVTPSRYADASVAQLADALPAGRPAAVVLNRLAVDGEDRRTLTDSVRERFGADLVEVDEHGDVALAATRLLDTIHVDSDGYDRAALVRAAASSAGRYVAHAATAAAPDIAAVAAAIDGVDTTSSAPVTHTVLEEWPDTRAEIVREVGVARRTVDERIRTGSNVDLAARIRSSLPDWEPGPLASALDRWRDRTVDRFEADARVRWRHAAARSMLDRYAWRMALNPWVEVPPRVRRIMGPRLSSVRDETSDELTGLVRGSVASRSDEWRAVVADIGGYAPGILLEAADGFGAPGA